MIEEFVNPITLSFRLLESYKKLLCDTLKAHGLKETDVESVLKTVQVDRGLYFSINRNYKQSTPFADFSRLEDLSSAFPACFPKLVNLHSHQEKAIRAIMAGSHTVISTGTGSGKTESFLVPIIDYCLKNPGKGVKALIIYPMNALANDQLRRLSKTLAGTSLKFGTFIGSTPETEKEEVIEPIGENHLVYRSEMRANPPDILFTNYVMLDRMLTRPNDLRIFQDSAPSLHFVVLDEIHTYRGNKATHLKYLLARLKANLKNPPLYIGTSATLRANSAQNSKMDEVDEFIKPLLDIKEYTLIEPEYEPEQEIQPTPIPPAVFEAQDLLDWSMSGEIAQGLHMLGLLTGKQYANTFDETLASAFEDLQRNEFLVHMRKALVEKNAQSFGDLVSLLSGLSPAGKPLHSPERIVKAYLSAVSFYNHLDSKHPVLDYRLHLFARNISGHLKMCIKCRQYHSGAQDFCQECGFPLFYVYKNDIHKCIGKVSGNRLKWSLLKESDDRKNSYFTLVEILDDTPDEGMNFDHEAPIMSEELLLNYDPYGRLRLTLLDGINHDNVFENSILLIDPRDDHEYLYQFIKSLLAELPKNKRKILGFVDNREKASQYGMVLRHEFASDFFLEFLKLQYPHERKLNLEDAWDYLKEQIPQEDVLGEVEKELFEDFQLWYALLIKTPLSRLNAVSDHLELKSPEDFDGAEREVIDVFLRERAIQLSYRSGKLGKYIRFRTYYASQFKGIHIRAEDASKLPQHPSISLSPEAEEYSDLVKKYDGKEKESIQDIVNRLVARGVLIEGQTADEKTQYYLSPTYIAFNYQLSEFGDYEKMKEQLLLTAAVHSSEIKDNERRGTERRFQDGEVNFVMATPTLEMGIDIGDLEVVLMTGIPPLPSNYAQRAGRAGRSQKSKFAISLAFCFENSNHDNYYFQYPKQMIDGEISPPSFNPLNNEVIQKHFNAFILTGEQIKEKELLRLVQQIPDQKLREAADVLGINGETAKKFLSDFISQIQGRLSELSTGNVRSRLYASGLFPDYAFRHDQVHAIPEGKAKELEDENFTPNQILEDLAISSREPEMAYYKFVPGEEVFMAGDAYTIIPVGRYNEFKIAGDQSTRSYVYIEASKKEGFASRSKVRKKYELSQRFEEPEIYRTVQGILGVAYQSECNLLFLNTGKKEQDKTTKFIDADSNFAIGYRVKRQALILRFDSVVCAEETYYLSLSSVLDREIKDRYGLDESEVKVLINAHPSKHSSEDDKFIYVIFYDAMGNGNVPLKRMEAEFGDILEGAYQRLATCTGNNNNGCANGCYRCLKSYNLQQSAHLIEKNIAVMFAGYLTGKNHFLPSLSLPETSSFHPDLTFEISLSGNVVTLKSKQIYTDQITGSQNQAIFNLMAKVIKAEFQENMQGLLIRAKQDYLVDAIEHGEISKDRQDFARLQFNLLRFKHVKAEKG